MSSLWGSSTLFTNCTWLNTLLTVRASSTVIVFPWVNNQLMFLGVLKIGQSYFHLSKSLTSKLAPSLKKLIFVPGAWTVRKIKLVLCLSIHPVIFLVTKTRFNLKYTQKLISLVNCFQCVPLVQLWKVHHFLFLALLHISFARIKFNGRCLIQVFLLIQIEIFSRSKLKSKSLNYANVFFRWCLNSSITTKLFWLREMALN